MRDSTSIASHEQRMASLKQDLNVISDAIPRGSRTVYLDMPMHLNIGDQLIDWGAQVFLEEKGLTPRLRFSAHDCKKFLHKIEKDDVILLHGGGNMNDIWPLHEQTRQNVLKAFPDNKIVVFPQSVHFKDEAKGRALLKTYEQHKDCTIFVRDAHSLNFISDAVKVNCQLCPDTAHALWKAEKGISPTYAGFGKLIFLRNDIEAAAQPVITGKSIDWDDLISPADHTVSKYLLAALSRSPSYALTRILLKVWDNRKEAIIQKCVRQFAAYDQVYTDRLHGMILSCLLGKEVFYSDNSYGKLSKYAETWFKESVMRLAA